MDPQTVPKRARRFRMKRLMGAYRLGDSKPRRDAELERERLTLELAGESVKAAVRLAESRAGEDVRKYCARLLERALESESIGAQLAEVEEKRGAPLAGLKAVADDPEYLAEWSARSAARRHTAPDVDYHPDPNAAPSAVAIDLREYLAAPAANPALVPVLATLHAHAGLRETDDREPTRGLIPTLRRGDDVTPDDARTVRTALDAIEISLRDSALIDRRVAFALHRLAFEAQVLHTDAFPGRFGATTIALLVEVQERVDRILSGIEIHYEEPRSTGIERESAS